MKFTGICKEVLPQQTGTSQRTGNSWVSQEFCFEEEGQRFPMSLCARVFGADKIAEMNIQAGVRYEIEFDITANKSQKTGGYFNSLNIWKATPLDGVQAQPSATNQPNTGMPPMGAPAAPPMGGGYPQANAPQPNYGAQPNYGGQPYGGGYPQNNVPFPTSGGVPNQATQSGGVQAGGSPFPPPTDPQGNPLPF